MFHGPPHSFASPQCPSYISNSESTFQGGGTWSARRGLMLAFLVTLGHSMRLAPSQRPRLPSQASHPLSAATFTGMWRNPPRLRAPAEITAPFPGGGAPGPASSQPAPPRAVSARSLAAVTRQAPPGRSPPQHFSSQVMSLTAMMCPPSFQDINH